MTLVAIVAAVLRAVRLDHPVRYDEAFSYLVYASGEEPSVWLAYTYPNNHLLHTLLVHLSTALGGPGAPALRAPAFLAGVLLVPLAAILAQRLSGRMVDALYAALLVGASSILVEYSVNARGYSMVCAATMVMCLASMAIDRHPQNRMPWIIWVSAAIAGLFTIPIMLYPIGILSGVIAVNAIRKRTSVGVTLATLVVALMVTMAITSLLYLPSITITGLDAVIFNQFVQPMPVGDVIHLLPENVAATCAHWFRDLSGFVLVVVAGLVTSIFLGIRGRDPFLVLPLVAPPVLLAAALTQRVVPFPRVWLFLLPVLLVCAAVGLGQITVIVQKNKLLALCVFSSVFALAVTQGSRVLAREYLISEEPRTLVDAAEIVRDLAPFNDPMTALTYEIPSGPSLAYYTIVQGRGFWVSPDETNVTRSFVIVSQGQTLEEVIAGFPTLVSRIDSIEPRFKYPHAEVWEAALIEDY